MVSGSYFQCCMQPLMLNFFMSYSHWLAGVFYRLSVGGILFGVCNLVSRLSHLNVPWGERWPWEQGCGVWSIFDEHRVKMLRHDIAPVLVCLVESNETLILLLDVCRRLMMGVTDGRGLRGRFHINIALSRREKSVWKGKLSSNRWR